ncbi:DDE_3 domain-containing protein [Trichonephila clavipes]|nr:DDE_3 domain-containing protein [Trichonephila clavipes]
MDYLAEKFWGRIHLAISLVGRRSPLSLENKIILYKQILRPVITYGSPVWSAAASTHMKKIQDITRMDFPAYSPDLNPIENVWDMLDRRIAARQSHPTCLPELRKAMLNEWCNIPQDQVDNLILSMSRRSFEVYPDFVMNLLNLSVEDRQTKAEQQLQVTNSQLEFKKIKLQQIEKEIEHQKTLAEGQATQQSSKGDTNNLENLIKDWPTGRCKRRMGEPTTENEKSSISERRVETNREDLVWKQDVARDFALMR